MKLYETDYYGVWVLFADGNWWLETDSGNQDYCGPGRPTLEAITAYCEKGEIKWSSKR